MPSKSNAMKCIYLFCILLSCLSSEAQFKFGYAPSKWSTALSPGSTGSVNTAAAPTSITITGSDGVQANNIDVDYTITAVASGPFSFSWSYHTNDSDKDPQYDRAFVLVGGTTTQLSANTLNLVDQSGTWSGSATAGAVIGFRLRATDNIYGNATFTISNFSPPGGVLPVNLLSFTAQKQNTSVVLAWQSAAETNFSHYLIQRSTDGVSFNNLQKVTAIGENKTYKVVDAHPAPGNNYYRLKMVDNDSAATYSKTINLDMGYRGLAFSIAPNPAKDVCTVRINAASSFAETISITNAAGAIMSFEKIRLHEGVNEKQINIAGLAKGIYWLSLQTSGCTLQLVKQ